MRSEKSGLRVSRRGGRVRGGGGEGKSGGAGGEGKRGGGRGRERRRAVSYTHLRAHETEADL
eukprot:1603352-Rhodomonas_salina.1